MVLTATNSQADIKTKPRYKFRSDATYVIAGGLGGLGRTFARWMASRGARNLVLLSRSGASTEAARTLVSEMESGGIRLVTPKVDIGDRAALERELAACREAGMPPVRGCIQATVALRDNLFPNMTHDDWAVSTSSKATGSANLDAVLPDDLDFFVLLASLNGVLGGRGQANYAAGNTFQDALAQRRIAAGQKAVSIDLGLMFEEGVVAENSGLLASMRRIGHLMDIESRELMALMDHYCDPDLPLAAEGDAQILVGLETTAAVRAKGIELHHAIYRPIFRQLFRMGPTPLGGDASHPSGMAAGAAAAVDRPAALAQAAAQGGDAGELVTSWFRAKIAQVLGLAEDDIDVTKPMVTLGIDSLVAIDLRNWFAREVGADVQVFALLDNQPATDLCAKAARESRYLPA